VIGIGAQAPPELQAEGFSVGMIIYNSEWDPTLTTPQVKYMFLGSKVQAGTGGLFFIGMAVAPNAAANPNNVVLNNGLQIEALNAAGQATTSGMITQVAAFNGTATLLESWLKTTPLVTARYSHSPTADHHPPLHLT